MQELTPHFTLEELVFSQTAARLGIDNTPPQAVVENLKALANGLEQVRELLGCPVNINSGYRSEELNAKIGGVKNCANTEGFAADFTAKEFGTPKQICEAIAASKIQFDQLIQEGTWVHISFAPAMRRQLLTASFSGGKASYSQGVSDG